MTKPSNPPAFPSHGSMGEVCQEGMSLRDWFAGMALTGLAARSIQLSVINRKVSDYSEDCYKLADAMLAEREKEASR